MNSLLLMTRIIPDEEGQSARILSEAICHVWSDSAACRAMQITAGDDPDVRFNRSARGAAAEQEIVRMKGMRDGY